MLSVVIPSYNEEKMISITAKTVSGILQSKNILYELIFVNDGSKDSTWDEIEKVAQNDPCVLGINFSRNFGKESAIFAGLQNASGDCVAVMDCDLQHPPEVLLEMYDLWQKGYEVIEGIKRSRGKENPIHKFCANLFYKIMSGAVGIDMSSASDFKLMDKKVVKSLTEMPERNAFFRALSSWVGFKSVSVEFDVQARIQGESKWSAWSLIKYAIRNIVGFSAAPLQMITVAGGITLLFGVVLGIFSLVQYFSGHAVEGFTTVILLILIIGSLMMISLGIIGVYISKIYEEIKRRPRYIISSMTNKTFNS